MALILASGSPRRRELMSLITPDYTVITSDVDETKIAADSPAHLAKALATAKAFFQTLRRRCDEGGYGDILLCPETMGKINQLGDLEEVLAICAPSEGLLPCVDFGHLYARSLGALDGAPRERA